MLNLYWCSWVQPTDDYRPLAYPPNPNVVGWWCSGYCDAGATLVSYVMAESEDAAYQVIKKDWPEIYEWRFINQRLEYTASDRFPPDPKYTPDRIKDWNTINLLQTFKYIF